MTMLREMGATDIQDDLWRVWRANRLFRACRQAALERNMQRRQLGEAARA
jgi:hypothetical protein